MDSGVPTLPDALVRSIAWDQGAEMSTHQKPRQIVLMGAPRAAVA